MTVKCAVCGGECILGNTDALRYRGQLRVLITDVPAKICSNCGESWIKINEEKIIDKLLLSLHPSIYSSTVFSVQFSLLKMSRLGIGRRAFSVGHVLGGHVRSHSAGFARVRSQLNSSKQSSSKSNRMFDSLLAKKRV